ncbi:uncharacterized protein YecE (DUF72 family) [Melghirimyces profundicolus]|uniref:Uncharacterized protein YecE (DUF72 family) n=1 Tax=Melghirimyces profundicolus TaxID=1242148 RepID=A0A2T6C7L0_9BACL|nr:DUF72 domain-containing protein [Melghirimyces profundicolus]PTX64314.1 uncharacterized protein YecE (DUF72 family) [Melghirimyces profundicolus]
MESQSGPVNPVQIGVCGWGDHDLYPPGTPSREKLSLYAGHFPVVEVDSTYHAIQPRERMAQWTEETPKDFRFVVKAYREMTGHGRREGAPVRSVKEIFREFVDSLEPMAKAGKLTAVLFQFPPWYDCNRDHVRYIRQSRQAVPDLPMAVEFRNRTWFEPRYRDRTLRFLVEEQLIHVVCDEPQAGIGSVPVVPAVTHPAQGLIRFHGRNVSGWNKSGRSNSHWRDVRYAYRYSRKELGEWVGRVVGMKEQADQITLLFNNNSRGDAADNAKEMIDLLGIDLNGLGPRQMDMFRWT